MKYRLLIALVCSGLCLNAQSPYPSGFLFSDPPFQQCHASTLVELQSGKLLAAFFAGTGEGKNDVGIWLSALQGGNWNAPVEVANGRVNDTVYPCWNPVLFQSSSGKLFLFYKVGPSPQKWWGMVKMSNDEGRSWGAPTRLPDQILGPIKNKPLQLPDGTILSPSSVETPLKWSVHIERSIDDGKTWQKIKIDTTSSFNPIQPSILAYADGRLQILCRSKEGKVIQAWSSDNGSSWSKLTETSLVNPNAGTDAATLASGQQFIVYNPALPGKEWWEGRAKLWCAVSADGHVWKKVLELENHESGEYSYPAVIVTRKGDVHITYTYQRKNIKHVWISRSSSYFAGVITMFLYSMGP